MAHARSHSQPIQYRYRPNGPPRGASTHISSNTFHITPPSGYVTPRMTDTPPRFANVEGSFLQSTLHCGSGAPLDHGFSMMDQPTMAFDKCTQKMDPPLLLSPNMSPWMSTDSSVNGDSCTGGAWSSPESNMSFSPEPTYQIPYMDSATWPQQISDSYLQGHCVSMQHMLPSQPMEYDCITAPIQFPDMAQEWQYSYAKDILAPAFEPTEYCSSRGSSESISEQAISSNEKVGTVIQRSDSFMTNTSSSSPLTVSPKGTGSPSPTSKPKRSQFQGQLLDFSTPVAQAKAKGPSFAALPCPLAAYGCASSFISKNEWKRHINTQHLRLEAWLCDQCPKRDNKREFNRKDLFIQHLKRMHPPPCPAHPPESQPAKVKSSKSAPKKEKSGKASKSDDLDPALLEAEQRCHLVLRQPPSDSACLFCPTNFSGRGSWESRIEHIAKHMEQYKKEGSDVPSPQTWRADRALEQWLTSEGVITKVRQRWSVV